MIKMLNEDIDKLAQENNQLKEVINRLNAFIDAHDKRAGNLYYKYDNKYLLSEFKEDIRNILKKVKK